MSPMQFSRRGQPAPPGVLFDSSLDGGIDQILALAMLFGLAANQQIRVPSASTSRFNLRMPPSSISSRVSSRRAGRRFRPEQNPAPDRDVHGGQAGGHRAADAVRRAPKVGADGQPAYARGIEKLNDTADPVALIRNALTAQTRSERGGGARRVPRRISSR